MTAATVETAVERGGDGDGLHGSPTNASTEPTSGRIMARGRADVPLSKPEQCLPISKILIESLKSPAMVVGTNSYGKCRLNGMLAHPFFPQAVAENRNLSGESRTLGLSLALVAGGRSPEVYLHGERG